MTADVYTFDTQHEIGQSGEALLDAFFGPHFNIQVASRDQQRLGIDRIFTRPGGSRVAIEYKTDNTAGRTGNVFVETVSKDTPPARSGWAWTTHADKIIYYIPGRNVAYSITPRDLRRFVNQWITSYSLRAIPNPNYNTYGVLVPIVVFADIAVHTYEIRR